MFPKRSPEFAVFFIFLSTFFFLFCDWSILLGRVNDPKFFEAAVRNTLDNIWPRRFEERVNILFDYVIPG